MAKDSKKAAVKVAKAPKKVDYKSLDDKDLLKAIEELRSDLVVLKRATKMGDVQNVRAYNVRRKEYARALTVRNQVREVK